MNEHIYCNRSLYSVILEEIAPIDMQIQNDIGRLVDDYICAKEQEKASIQKRIDAKIYGLFGLTNDEITIIENAVSPVR